jgi:DmsE family decaheme c-type cytochrome
MSGIFEKAPDVLPISLNEQQPQKRAHRVRVMTKLSVLRSLPRMIIAGAFLFGQPVGAATVSPTPAQAGASNYASFQSYIQSNGAGAAQQADNGPDAYSVLATYVDAADSAKAGRAPDDEVHAKGRALGKAPSDATHASVKSATKSDGGDYAVLSDFAENAKPVVVAAAGEAAPAAAPAKHAKELPAKKFDDSEAVYVGSQACVKCHKNQFGTFSQTLHGDIFLKAPRNSLEKEGCEACHGPASRHVKSKEMDGGAAGDIVSFRKDSPRPVDERNAICLTCHEKGDRHNWAGSVHETRGLACTNCHQIMEKVSVKHQLIKSTELETCFQCHKDRRAQMFRASVHPLASGNMTCSSCHNPHGSATDKLLREASINETCYKCHADKRGPFLWEHEPVRDNCLNCHDPHGTSNEYMLKVQRPRLCTQCHAGGVGHGTPGNPTTVQAINRSCQNCHTKIHGSNAPAGMLFQR